MSKKTKELVYKILIIAAYILILAPVLYAIFYAVPASDDFAMTLGREDGRGVISELANDMSFFWNYRGGTFIYFFLELILSPLNAHVHLGHWYGLYMMVAYLLCLAGISYGLKMIYGRILGDEKKNKIEVATLLTIATMVCTYFYVEAHSWYVGMIGYQMPMAMIMISIGLTIRYAEGKLGKTGYILMIITGIIAANNFVYDIPIGLAYLYIMYYRKGIESIGKREQFKKTIPLTLYVLFGLLSVVAPGNFVRQTQYTDKPGFISCLIQTVVDVIARLKFVLMAHPVTVLLFFMLVILGYGANRLLKIKSINLMELALLAVVIAAAWVGSILPYIYGRGATSTYLDVRIEYVLDTFIEIGIAMICISIGMWFASVISVRNNMVMVATLIIPTLVLLGYTCTGGRQATILQVDLLYERPFITASYELWNGILTEIDNSVDDNVVVDREYNVNWNKFFLYSGMEPGEEYALALDTVYDSKQILPNVYYKKKSIIVNYPMK